MKAYERLLSYVKILTPSNEDSTTAPSSNCQFNLARILVDELKNLGISDVSLDEHCYVYAHIPASEGLDSCKTLGFIAHMDTVSDFCDHPVTPVITENYDGGDVVLPGTGAVLSTRQFPFLAKLKGQTLITTDGTTLLGADDKAGVAEIFAAVERLVRDPRLAHGRVAVCITPDEEVGRGADYVDLARLGAAFAYTVDGGPLGTLEYENFNAAAGTVLLHGVNIHPGEGKNKMRNACLMAAQFIAMVPPAEAPAHTEGYEGFYHLCAMTGDESQARLEWIIRDHDQARFAERKETLTRIGAYLERQYGPGSVEVILTDSYYNMKERILPHPQLLDWARVAFRKAGVEPRDVPIRGGTDGARLSYLGLPCPNLSTGGYHFHGVYEYIPVESLEKMTEMLVHLLTGIDGTKKNGKI